MPVVIRRLCLRSDRSTAEEERVARLNANKAAIALLEHIAKKDNLAGEAIDRLRGEYSERIQQLEQCAERPE